MKKKDIPINIHKIIEPNLMKFGKVFDIERVKQTNSYNDHLIKIIDVDTDSNFYFKIVSFNSQSGFTIERKPSSLGNNGEVTNLISENNASKYFNEWISLLETYDSTPTVFDDPILKRFEEEYFAEFELLDDNKDKPLDNRNILLLDEYLKNLIDNLEIRKSEENKLQIEEIQSNAVLLKESLTNKTRLEIVKNLSKIFAKVKKLGTSYLKEFITEGRKQLISKSVKFFIDQGPDIVQQIGSQP